MTGKSVSKTSGNGKLQLRPTLMIGLGGTGHRMVVGTKALAIQSWGYERVNQLLKFLVFDTAQEALGSQGISLEPGSEFVDIGQTPVANIKRNLDRQEAIQDRLGGVMAGLPPTVLRNGAKQLRPLGLLAFLWRYAEIEERLRDAIWSLAGRQRTEGREGINVFIVNSLVGGTGSSTFLDVAHLVRDLFDELGTLADFCYLTGVGVLPRAFHGIYGPNLIPNAVASLKELNHCMMRGGFTTRYPNGRTITTAQPPFNIYYLIDGVDERGHTWHGFNEVCRLASEAIFLQMGSQVGQKQENDFDNLDDVLAQQTADGEGTFHGSFGLASLMFAGPVVARACAARLAIQLIDRRLLAQPGSKAAQGTPAQGAQVDEFLQTAELTPDRLAEQLARDDQGVPLTVELTIPGWADRLPPQERSGHLIRHAREYERARLGADFKGWLTQNEGRLAGDAESLLITHVTRLAARQGLFAVENFLTTLLARVDELSAELTTGQTDRERQLANLTEELRHQESVFLQAGEGSFLGRNRRISRSQQAYFSLAERLYTLRWQTQITAGVLVILNYLSRVTRDGLAACQGTANRLQAVRRTLGHLATTFEDGETPAGVTTQTLANEAVVAALFERHAPPLSDLQASLFSGHFTLIDWHDTPLEAIQDTLLTVCRGPFETVAEMNVEDALAMRTEETSPEWYFNWLMKQATPSWNLERARLADGGKSLHRLEVVGVPDATQSLFKSRDTMLVSTGDRSRLTAFVAHIGAAHSAIQQWDNYLRAYEQVRGQVPLHILPQFQADNERARQAFALGTLFGFINNQGAYFYYQPVDNLSRPIKLAQGLANALQAFINQDGVVHEVWERVEQVVAKQGVEATLHRLTTYYNNNDRRYLADDLVLELKRLVRNYANELRQIHQFTGGPGSFNKDSFVNLDVEAPDAT